MNACHFWCNKRPAYLIFLRLCATHQSKLKLHSIPDQRLLWCCISDTALRFDIATQPIRTGKTERKVSFHENNVRSRLTRTKFIIRLKVDEQNAWFTLHPHSKHNQITTINYSHYMRKNNIQPTDLGSTFESDGLRRYDGKCFVRILNAVILLVGWCDDDHVMVWYQLNKIPDE